MENILNHLPECHARILKDLLAEIRKEKDKETRARMSCYYFGYVNCLSRSNLIIHEEWSYLNHQIEYEKKEV